MEKIIKYDNFLNEEVFTLTDSIPVKTLQSFSKFLIENQSFLWKNEQCVKISKIEKLDEMGREYNITFTVYKDKLCKVIGGKFETKFKII